MKRARKSKVSGLFLMEHRGFEPLASTMRMSIFAFLAFFYVEIPLFSGVFRPISFELSKYWGLLFLR